MIYQVTLRGLIVILALIAIASRANLRGVIGISLHFVRGLKQKYEFVG